MNYWLLIPIFLFFSLLGFVVEYINECFTGQCRAHYSSGSDWPFLPIYGIGAILLYLWTPVLRPYPLAIQYLIITLVLTFFEFSAGKLRERVSGAKSWGYGEQKEPIDLTHSLIWGAAGLVLVQVFARLQDYTA